MACTFHSIGDAPHTHMHVAGEMSTPNELLALWPQGGNWVEKKGKGLDKGEGWSVVQNPRVAQYASPTCPSQWIRIVVTHSVLNAY